MEPGYCQCGCGERAPIAKRTYARSGHVKGRPVRFISGHNARKKPPPAVIPTWGVGNGACECGCGGPTKLATSTDPKYGTIAGRPRRFLAGHHQAVTAAAKGPVGPDYRVDETGCWVWLKQTLRGYGVTGRRAGKIAHRLYWAERNGPIPEGMDLHHLCGNKSCVNPDHLEPVPSLSHQRMHRAKLDENKVHQIRKLASEGIARSALARRFGVSPTTVGNVIQRRSWADVL